MNRVHHTTTLAATLIALLGAMSWASAQDDGVRPPIPLENHSFESGDLTGWQGDPNWRVDDNSAGGWYSGWHGSVFAWSGEGGEATTGVLRSAPFTLERHGVSLRVAGWADHFGRTTDRWNYVRLMAADDTELDRVYAPNTTTFVKAFLYGQGREGEEVYVEAVDDAAEGSFSMICIDEVAQADVPPAPGLADLHDPEAIALENDFYRVEVRATNGVISRILDKAAGIELIREPRLAGNYRFTLPIRGAAAFESTEANYIVGNAQTLTSHTQEDNALELVWKGPLTSVKEMSCDVDVTMRIGLVDDRIEFGLRVANRTKYEIGELFYPVLGGMVGLVSNEPGRYQDPKATELVVPTTAGPTTARIFHTFVNQSAFGAIGPEQHYGYPDQAAMPWMTLQHGRLGRAMYLGAHDPVFRYKVMHVDMLPGVAGARAEGNWPRPDEARGMPVGVRMSFVHMPYEPAWRTFEATPVVLRCYDGDWREGMQTYAAWMRTLDAPRAVSADAPAGWLECDAPRASELAALAEQAQAAGFDALLLRNWETGGDDGLPTLTIDTELGSPQEYREAIAACKALGVRVFLTFDIEPAARDTALYRNELRRYTAVDRWGVDETVMGWSEGGSWSQATATAERRAVLNPGIQAFRARLVRSVEALARLGVDGIHVGRYFGRALDFNTRARMTADRASWEGGLATMHAIIAAAAARNPDFAVTTEGATMDRLLPAVAAGGVARGRAVPIVAEAFPEWRPIRRIGSASDYLEASLGLRDGAIIAAPAQLDGEAFGEGPSAEFARYVRALMGLRAEAAEAGLTPAPEESVQLEPPGVLASSVWTDGAGLRACLLVNTSSEEVTCAVTAFGPVTAGAVVLRDPSTGAVETMTLPATVRVAPGRAVAIANE